MATITALTANLELNAAQFRKEMDAASKRIDKFERKSKKANKEVSNLQRAFRGAATGIATIDGPLGGISSRLTGMNTLLTSGAAGWLALGAGIAAATFATVKGISAFGELEQSQLKTEALLKATGGAAGRTAQQLEDQARATARATLANSRGIREAQQILLTFKTVQTDIFDKSIVLSQDLAAVMGGTAKTAALQLGKALESPSIGLTALRRSGVSFTQSEKELIKEMEEMGRIAEAQGLILGKLEQQIGGAGSAEAGGLKGATDSMAQSWEELLEAFGKGGAGNAAKSTISWITGALDSFRFAALATDREKDLKQYTALLEKLHELEQNSGAGRHYSTRLNQVKVEIQRIEERFKASFEAQRKANEAAEESARISREQYEAESRLARLKQAQEKGVNTAQNLDSTLGGQEEKLRIEHQKRLEIINTLQLEELKIRQRGFENIEQLREAYAQRSTDKMQASLVAITEKEQLAQAKIISFHQEKYNRLHEEALAAQGLDAELENLRYERQVKQIQRDLSLLIEKGLLTEAIRAQQRQAEMDAEILHQENVKKINEDRVKEWSAAWEHAFERFAAGVGDATANAIFSGENLSESLKSAVRGIAKQVVSSLIEIGVQKLVLSTLGKTLLAIETAAAVTAGTVTATAWAPAAAMASLASFGANAVPAAAGIVSTVALTESLSVLGVAHDGMMIPQDGPYLLQGGEYVVNKDTASEALDNVLMGKGGGSKVVINLFGAPEGTRVSESTPAKGDTQIDIDLMEQHLAQGILDGDSSISSALDQKYQSIRGIG